MKKILLGICLLSSATTGFSVEKKMHHLVLEAGLSGTISIVAENDSNSIPNDVEYIQPSVLFNLGIGYHFYNYYSFKTKFIYGSVFQSQIDPYGFLMKGFHLVGFDFLFEALYPFYQNEQYVLKGGVEIGGGFLYGIYHATDAPFFAPSFDSLLYLSFIQKKQEAVAYKLGIPIKAIFRKDVDYTVSTGLSFIVEFTPTRLSD